MGLNKIISQMDTMKTSIPDNLISGFRHHFIIENLLRELIIDELSKIAGLFWYKHRLPGDALNSFKEGKNYEKRQKWRGLISYHPVYYLDFPDLRKTITRKDNWEASFKKIFSNEPQFSEQLRSIEPIRNSIAHNRNITDLDISKIDLVEKYITASIGAERATDLLAKTTSVESIDRLLQSIVDELRSIHIKILKCEQFFNCDALTNYTNQWWFNDEYLGSNLEKPLEVIEIIKWYSSLKRVRGDGYKIKTELKKRSYEESYDSALQTISDLKK